MENVIKFDPKYHTTFLIGSIYFRLKEYAIAKIIFKKLKKDCETHLYYKEKMACHEKLGKIYREDNDHEAALR